MSGPEPTERSEPGIHLLKWFWLQPVETALCVHRGFHETGLAQHAQVLGDRGLWHPQSALDLSHRLLGQDQEAQDRAAVRLRDDCERRLHGVNIPQRAYTCQGIYRSSRSPTAKVAAGLHLHLQSGRRDLTRPARRASSTSAVVTTAPKPF